MGVGSGRRSSRDVGFNQYIHFGLVGGGWRWLIVVGGHQGISVLAKIAVLGWSAVVGVFCPKYTDHRRPPPNTADKLRIYFFILILC